MMTITTKTTLQDRLADAFGSITADQCSYDGGDDGRGGWIHATVRIDGITCYVDWCLHTRPDGLGSADADDVRRHGYLVKPYCDIDWIDIPDQLPSDLGMETDEIELLIRDLWHEVADSELAEKIWRNALAAKIDVNRLGIGDLLRIIPPTD